jgi:hypothetical protein
MDGPFRDCRERCHPIRKLESEIARHIIREFEDRQRVERLQELYNSAYEVSIRKAEEVIHLKSCLRKLEWINGRCPVCKYLQNSRHASDCQLLKALTEH